jgi:hypothetical protein
MLRQLLTVAVAAVAATSTVAQTPAPVVQTPTPVVQTPAPVVQTTAPVVIYQSEPVVVSGPVIYSRTVVQRPQPAVGLGAVNSPFYFYPELTIGGPGHMYRSTPPHNGWSSGYRGAYYGEPVPGSITRRGPWSR